MATAEKHKMRPRRRYRIDRQNMAYMSAQSARAAYTRQMVKVGRTESRSFMDMVATMMSTIRAGMNRIGKGKNDG